MRHAEHALNYKFIQNICMLKTVADRSEALDQRSAVRDQRSVSRDRGPPINRDFRYAPPRKNRDLRFASTSRDRGSEVSKQGSGLGCQFFSYFRSFVLS